MGQQIQTLPNGTQIESVGPQGQYRVLGGPRSAVALPEQPSLAALAGEGPKSEEAPVQAGDPKGLMPYALMALQGMIGR